MNFSDILNYRPYTLFDAFSKGADMAQKYKDQSLHNKYAPKEEEAKLQSMYALTQAHQAEAQAAPEYYRGQADLVSNQAALLPKEFALKQHRASMADLLDNARLAALQQQLHQSPQFSPQSDVGKMVADRDYIIKNSPLGEKDPAAIALNNEISLAPKGVEAGITYKNSIGNYYNSPGAQLRGLSALGKTYEEPNIIAQSQGQSMVSPEIANAYAQNRQKMTTDTNVRQKALYAQNIDKSFNMIDPSVMKAYSGPKGQLRYQADRAAALAGAPTPQFLAFQNFQNVTAPMLAHQLRQFYGDSIQPQVVAAINAMVDPVSMAKSPQEAINSYNTLRSTLRNEMSTYTNALNSPVGGKSNGNVNDQRGLQQSGVSGGSKILDYSSVSLEKLKERAAELKGMLSR